MATDDRIGATTFSTPSDVELVAKRVVDAPRTLVWQIFTEPEHLPNWLTGPEGWTMTVCEIDLRPGGAWRWAWSGPEGADLEMHGVYREIVAPERLVNTESWGDDWPETVTTLTLSEDRERTTITQSVLYPSREARDAAIGTGMKDGWAASYDRLAEYLPALVAAA